MSRAVKSTMDGVVRMLKSVRKTQWNGEGREWEGVSGESGKKIQECVGL